MDCCILSAEEVGRLQHYNILPDHEEHSHIDSKEAIKGVIDESFSLVESKDGRYYVTPSKLHFLRALPSGPSKIKIIQRVISNHILELKPIR